MKKIASLFALFLFIISFSQCNISGKSSIKISEEETYSVPNEIAQCKECHLWISVGSNTAISTDNKLNFIKLKPNSAGRLILSATVLTSQGILQCSKNIDVLDNTKQSDNLDKATLTTINNCDIQINNYKEVKYAENIVSFFPNETNNDFRYEWIVNYANGESMKSNEKIPQFPFTKENGIATVKLKISSKVCLREFSKTYDANYWKFF